MQHALFPTVEALLAPAVLSELLGESVTSVATRPMHARYNLSGSRLLHVDVNEGAGTPLVLKRVSLRDDWHMRLTNDVRCRSVALWAHGVLDLMPPEIDHTTLACARDGEDWAILLRDVSADLLPYTPFTPTDNDFMLDAMAALHATFFDSPLLKDPALGLADLCDVYSLFAPRNAQGVLHEQHELPQRIIEGWQMVKAAVPTDVARIVFPLLDDPTPLRDAFGRYPATLVHGDWRHANQGLRRNAHPRLILFDWQLAVAAPPGVELGRGLNTNSVLLPVSKEDAVDIYKQHLARRLGPRFDEGWWEPQLALGLLGGFVQDGWAIILKATHWHVGEGARAHWQADLRWWSERVRDGMKWL